MTIAPLDTAGGAAALPRAFRIETAMQHFSVSGLAQQIGSNNFADWPRALLRELMDNALDACEAAGIAP